MALKTDLKAVYKLDESSGSTATDSHGSNDGTYNGNLPTAVSGKDGDAQSFNNSNNDYIRSNDNVSQFISDASKNWSVSLWFKHSTDSVNSLFSASEVAFGGSDSLTIRKETGGKILALSYDGSGQKITSGSGYDDGKWHHLVYKGDSNQLELFIDGQSVGTTSQNNPDLSGSSRISIGRRDRGDRYVTADIDEVYIWDRAISSSEVSDLYNSGTGKFYPFDTIVSVSAAQSITTDTPATEDVVIEMASDYLITATDKGAEITTKHPMNTLSVGKGGPGSRFIEHEWPNKEGLSAGITKQTGNPVLREE